MLVRLPFLGAAPGADEAGFLMVARQWQPGTSLYGDLWVDRPPLLLELFALADALGGLTALRVLGCLAVALVVVLASLAGWQVRGRTGAAWAGAVAAALVSSPMLDAREVNGELLGAPFVLGSFVLALAVPRRPWAAPAAGACALAAVLIKQSLLDGVVFGLVLLIALRLTGRTSTARLLRDLGAAVAGALAGLGLVLAASAARGTYPGELWSALVVFRADAAGVIATSASAATDDRLARLALVALLSGLVPLAVAVVVRVVRRRGRDAVACAVLAVLVWDLVAVLSGGSYWLHDLMQLAPAAALAAAVTTAGIGWPRRVGRAAAVVAGVAGLVAVAVTPPTPPNDSNRAGTWLGTAADAGDTAVVAFGRPDLLERAGLSSPYPLLWSLPVRVSDPRLGLLAGVLDGPARPTWVLVRGGTLDSWGISPGAGAVAALDARYRLVQTVCGYAVYLLEGQERQLPPGPPTCPATNAR